MPSVSRSLLVISLYLSLSLLVFSQIGSQREPRSRQSEHTGSGRPQRTLSLFEGSQPLYTEGADNNFFGHGAGESNTTGFGNSFFGAEAGALNVSGDSNSFFGNAAGYANTEGNWNSFFGDRAGWNNTTGFANASFGWEAGRENTSGTHNCFLGVGAGFSNLTGSSNTCVGNAAGLFNTYQDYNTFIGAQSDLDNSPTIHAITNATAIGARAYVSQPNSLVLGSIAGVNGATSYVNVGIGTPAPARQLHIAGPNAVFRMDRTTDTAAFIMVRTDPTGVTPWKTFVVGTNATGVNTGEFIINDVGTAVGGLGNRRMTITNEGNVTFNGNVYAASFMPTSSLAFKTNIRTFENALETVNRLRGVRFDWKESGKPSVGLIAEEVDQVLPELVAHEGGTAKGVNYASLVAVLVEAVKEQQEASQADRRTIREQQEEILSLKSRLERVESLMTER